jgi:hypothetical protein
MKKLMFVLMMLSSILTMAQDTSPVKWTFSSKKGNNPNEYIITAKANIQKGFHVFAPDPGGDGLLIPTEMNVENKDKFKNVGNLIPQRRPITKEMKGIGMVNYYESEIEFHLTVESENPGTVIGVMSSQACNDLMCFPPTDVEFNIKL